MSDRWGPLDRLVGQAEALAGAWGARARASTTIGQERAILRLFGVSGVDAAGRPLAGTTVDRWLAGESRGLGAGITLPFAMALLEYDLDPQQLALDVATGAVDLALEAALLREPDRRAVAEAEASRLAAAAVERIDAERTARHETIALLGDSPRPWLGTTLHQPDEDAALEEAAVLIVAGLDLIRIEVPIGRELAARLSAAGREVPEWRPREGARGAPGRELADPAPIGSQRALALLRLAVDRAAAERQKYVRLATVIPALGSPEGAVVAAFERIDLIASDAIAEIVADGVEPDRALADHAFAHRLVRRAGTAIVVGPGPLVVAPDLSAGQPSDPATRAGRALALQLIGIALARDDGLPADQIVVGALPPWVADEPAPAARAIAEVAVRRALFPGHPFAFVEPAAGQPGSALWPYVQAAAAVHAGDLAFVLRQYDPWADTDDAEVQGLRAGSAVAAEAAAAAPPGPLAGLALEHARSMVNAGVATLEQLADHGWGTVAGDRPGAGRASARGLDAVAERTESFDPFEPLLGSRG
ncbi:MAG: lysine 5,6-aminomutase subunit alpha [Candidatus Limnocylindrales bacterium]|nr:lysine 5,6-aminomutase subunit alpha [Candidatus Limnocylindrales bacterium]